MRWWLTSLAVSLTMAADAMLATPTALADNKRLNDGVVANVYTVQHQAGCTNDVKINPQLRLAAQWHTDDVLNNRALDGDIGSDGSTPQVRAADDVWLNNYSIEMMIWVDSAGRSLAGSTRLGSATISGCVRRSMAGLSSRRRIR